MPMGRRFRLNYSASLLFACPISLSVLSDLQPTQVSVISVAHSRFGSGGGEVPVDQIRTASSTC